MTHTFKNFLFGIIAIAFIPAFGFAQEQVHSEEKVAPKNWHLLDYKDSGYFGISLDKAYEFLKGRKSQKVIVAVIDSGVDTLQEDLKSVLWTNRREIPGNGIDDDGNGYIDDIHGWNFLGGKDGQNVDQDSYEGARVYWKLKEKYGDQLPDTNKLTGQDRIDAVTFYRAKESVVDNVDMSQVMVFQKMLEILEKGDPIIAKDLGKETFTGEDLKTYNPSNDDAKKAAGIYLNMCRANNNFDLTNKDFLGYFKGEVAKADAAQNPPPNFRNMIVKDDYEDITDKFYGNTDLMTGSPMHGTHCAGIIGADRKNGIGINGVADNVELMIIRAVPDGDEHDKDIANGIYYAVNNGAKIISMSFGKSFSPYKKWIDDAIKYAQSKGVLLVHAAGNDAKNLDVDYNFPTPYYLNSKEKAPNFITVGASGDHANGGLVASFSNYGKTMVDVFAPGVNIYSTLPGGNQYGNLSGTSMAAPVVSGIAALLLEYFPTLSAEQIKWVIENSVTPVTEEVKLPGTSDMVKLSDISVTGGIVNAYNAVKLAATLKGERKTLINGPKKKFKAPKSKTVVK